MATNNSVNAPTTNGTVVTGNGSGYTNIAYSATGGTSNIVSRDSSGNSATNNFISGSTNTTSASSTTVLTAASTRVQVLQGTQIQTYQLPNATTLSIGATFEFNNNSTGVLTVVDAASGGVTTIPSGGYARVIAQSVSTSAGSWDKHFLIPANGSYGTAGLSITGNLAVTGLTGILTGNGSSNISASTVTQNNVLIAGASNTISSVSPGSSGNILTSDGTNWTSALPAASAIAGLGSYGDGSDGSVTFDGTTTILGMVPTLNTYTLHRDLYLQSSTINSGVIINPNSNRIFCNGTLTNNGFISSNGSAGSNTGTAGAGAAPSGNFTLGSAGGNGGTGSLTTGANGVSKTNSLGGKGGDGGAGSSAGGFSGSAIFPATGTFPRFQPLTQLVIFPNIAAWTKLDTGSGGGGGGGDATITGGGGGGGGGIACLICLFISGTGTIRCLGGDGGNGGVGGTNCGGGGAGGGGVILITSRSSSSNTIPGQTLDVSGGNGGIATGSGVNGSNGSPGTIIVLPD